LHATHEAPQIMLRFYLNCCRLFYPLAIRLLAVSPLRIFGKTARTLVPNETGFGF